MKTGHFAGPLFLVGMPRSGTKLLRNMLNQHALIRFSPIETEFFPLWVSRWQRFGRIDNRKGFGQFFSKCSHLPFFVENAKRGVQIDCDEWFNACKAFTPADVFEALMRCVLSIGLQDTTTIWGDKSPSYIRHVPLLRQQFPEARIIHIVRDVRDYSLSIHKAWGKSVLRGAQRWQDDVSKCRKDGADLAYGYLEIRFEDLLDEPETQINRVCKFIDADFDRRMLKPGAQTENLGDAKGIEGVLRSNRGKYQRAMRASTVGRIEKIACPTLRDLDYPCDYQGQPIRLGPLTLRVLKLSDGINLIRSSMSELGLVEALKARLRLFMASSARLR